MKKLLPIALLGLTLSVAKAQNGFTTFTANISIPGNIINERALLVDNVGNKWIGFNALSGNGCLLKYNGTSSTLYNSTNCPAFSTNQVTALAQDASGNIWVGTNQGLVKYNGTAFTIYDVTNGLVSNTITCLEAIGSQVYVGSRLGMSRFDGVTFTNYTLANGKLPNDSVFSIKAQSPTTLWLGGVNRLVEFSINSNFTTTTFTSNTTPSNQLSYLTTKAGIINCIYIDAQQKKWLGSTNSGALVFSGNTFNYASNIYDIYGCPLRYKIVSMCQGLNGGVAMKMAQANGNQGIGIIELAPNGKVYQYTFPIPNQNVSDYIQKSGTSLIISQNAVVASTTAGLQKIFHVFDKTNYITPLGNINSNNFKSLDINQVKAGIANRSDMHWDGQSIGGYEVPKGSGKHLYAVTSLWIGGYDNANVLHGGAQTYRQAGNDFWPGPLDTISALTNTTVAANYDKIWKVSYTDINNFITNFNSGNVQNASYTPTEDILTWPAKGTGNFSRNLAPFVDINNNGIYDPLIGGDYPKIKGDQALYFIYNDNLQAHGNTSCTPMGIEVQAMAYAYGCNSVLSGKPELAYTTFYNYKIINRSANNYHDVYTSMWSDIDIGNYTDDYIGCNVADNYGYAYNSDNYDESVGVINGYLSFPPAQGIAVMKGPFAITNDGIDNNNNGIIDEPHEDYKMNKFTYFNYGLAGVPQNTTDPNTCSEYYNYMNAIWKDGTPFTCGGSAYSGTVASTPTNWVYTGDPNTGISTATNSSCGTANWLETGTAGDRRFLVTTGPYNLNAGQMQEVEYAFVTSFDSTSTTNANLLSVAKLKTDIQKVRNFYKLNNKPNCLQSITIGITENLKQSDFVLYPNPAKAAITIKSAIEGDVKINYVIYDVLGKTVFSNQQQQANFTININELNAGIYFLSLTINNSIVVKKFVKE